MPQTANKGYEVQTTGTNINTWGQILNDNMISFVDLNLGGVLTKTLSNVTENLTAAEARNGILRLIGTLSANVLVTTPNQGFQIVYNLTSGPFSVSFQRLGVGSPVIIPQGTAALITTDAAAGAQTGSDSRPEFAAGTSMLFLQASAPTGWTPQFTANNRGIQVVGANGGLLGGSASFSDTFTTRGLTGTVTGTAITTAQMPAHDHDLSGNYANDGNGPDGGGPANMMRDSATAGTYFDNTSIKFEGGNEAHTHGMSINNLNLNLAYITAMHCTKN